MSYSLESAISKAFQPFSYLAAFLLDTTRTYAAADALWEEQRGAERLAEKESQEEVSEPQDAPYLHHIAPPQRGDRVAVQLADGSLLSGVFDPSLPGQIDTDPERWNEASRLAALDMPQPVGTFVNDQDWVRKDIQDGDVDNARLDHITALLEDIRNTLTSAVSASFPEATAERPGSAPDPDPGHPTQRPSGCGPRCESWSPDDDLTQAVLRCRLREGHAGDHDSPTRTGNLTWPNSGAGVHLNPQRRAVGGRALASLSVPQVKRGRNRGSS